MQECVLFHKGFVPHFASLSAENRVLLAALAFVGGKCPVPHRIWVEPEDFEEAARLARVAWRGRRLKALLSAGAITPYGDGYLLTDLVRGV